MRSDETPHGIDGGGVPLTSEGVTRPRIVAARRPPRSVYSSGFRKRMASPRHDRSSVTKPSRASSYSKSDDRAPSRAWSRALSRISDVAKSSRSPRAGGKAPPRVTSVRGALYVGRGDRKKTGLCGGMPCATNSSTKTLPDPKGDAEGPSSSARLIWGCWCHLRRSFSKVSQLSIYPLLSAFLAFFCRAPRGGPRGCRRSLAERSLRYPSYTNFT